MSDCGCEIEIKNKAQSRVLMTLLVINISMFFIEITLGIMSDSTALIADSLDMLSDAAVYGIALYAVGRAARLKVGAAHLSGIFQIILGALVLADIVRRILFGSEPEPYFMVIVGGAALVANIICLLLISKHKEDEVHMRASWIFSKNDVIANVGIIASGVLVYLFDARYPDVIVGLMIAVLVIHGGLDIMRDANREKQILLLKNT